MITLQCHNDILTSGSDRHFLHLMTVKHETKTQFDALKQMERKPGDKRVTFMYMYNDAVLVARSN